jgi:AraC-like DNA-binding protein
MHTRTTDFFFLEARGKRLRMKTYAEDRLVDSTITLGRSHDWVHHVISLLDSALHQLYGTEITAHDTILKAASLLRQQIDPPTASEVPNGRGCLLAWQARKVRDYIDSHITGTVLVADLCALLQRSEAHFSRSFKRTFGESPHAFLVRRRVELAAQYMLTTDEALSDIALRCGFTDQAHLCKHFRQAAGQTPAAWRRAHSQVSILQRRSDSSNRANPPSDTLLLKAMLSRALASSTVQSTE